MISAAPACLTVAAVRSVLSAELGLTSEIARVTTPKESQRASGAFIAAADRHRVTQLLAPESQALGFSSEIGEALQAAQRKSKLQAMARVAETIRVSSVLRQAGLPHLILKGVALSAQTTGSPLWRVSGDVDVLIDPGAVRQAVGALEHSGMRRNPVCMSPEAPLFGYALRTQPEIMLLRGPRQLDLHWRLDNARTTLNWGFHELHRSAEWIEMGAAAVPTLSRRHAAVLNAANGAKDSWSQVQAIVDQVRLNRMSATRTLAEEARRVGAARRFELAVLMTELLLGIEASNHTWTLNHSARRMWAWILAGNEPLRRRTPGGAVRRFAINVLTYDSSREATERALTLFWPIEAMASRRLGDAGDRHPWLYAAGTPYYLPERLLARRSPPIGLDRPGIDRCLL